VTTSLVRSPRGALERKAFVMDRTVKNKKTVATRATEVAAGMKKRFPNGSQKITFGGGSFDVTVDQAVTNLQEIVTNRSAVTAARAAAKATVAEENAKMPALIAFMSALVAFIRLNFGADATALADFGLEPPRARTPMTAEEKAVAAARREATRKARGTAGPRAKKAVKGNVNATLVVTPASPPAAPAPGAEPATPPATPPKA